MRKCKKIKTEIMKVKLFLIWTFIIVSANLLGQVVYDTIPKKDYIFGGDIFEKPVVFRNFSGQFRENFIKIDFNKFPEKTGRVIVSTTFTKNGYIENTRIVKSINPYFDSIAFYSVSNLKDWLPGMRRGKFVDIDMTFPINFSSDLLKLKELEKGFDDLFKTTESEFKSRQNYFDFCNSNSEDQMIINNFEYFTNFIADNLSDSCFTYVFKYSRQDVDRKCRTKIILSNSNDSKLILINPHKKNIIYTTQNKSKLYLNKNIEYVLIAFKDVGTDNPKLAIKHIETRKINVFSLEFNSMTKKDFINELSKFVSLSKDLK
jgi:hypothetical protein